MDELKKRTHPTLVHFPVALMPVALLFLMIAWGQGNLVWLAASLWTFRVGAIFTLPVVVTGWYDWKRLHPASAQQDSTMQFHLRMGIAIAAISLLGLIFTWAWSPMNSIFGLGVFGLMVGGLTALVLLQGYIASVMVYRRHLGVDGITR